MTLDRMLLGAGAGVLALVVTFMMPVSVRRVNQAFISLLIAVLFFTAAFALLESPLSWIVAVGATLAAIIYRDVIRFVKHVYWNVTKYSRRDFWYRRVGQAILGNRRRRR